tara:strand:- start:298 stop:1065 length:768 start_codon:yes stop_codon:yes gene_type:complete
MTYSEIYSQYDHFMGRWSRKVCCQFLNQLTPERELKWLDVGCGIGVLGQIIVKNYSPSAVVGIDPLENSIKAAQKHADNIEIEFGIGKAEDLPFQDSSFDAVVSGLMIKFVPDQEKAIREMKRVTRVGGIVALYDWDITSNMNTTRHFWSAVDDTTSNPITPGPAAPAHKLELLFKEAGLSQVQQKKISFNSYFRNLDDYWRPITQNSQNVGRFYKKMSDEHQTAVFNRLKETLPFKSDGSIQFESRAIMASGYA